MLVNGREYSYGDIRVSFLGNSPAGFRGINYSVSQTKENIYGQGNQPVARGRGNKEYEGSVRLLFKEVQAILDALPLPNQDLTDIGLFEIAVTYLNSENKLVTHVLRNCEFTECAIDWAQGDTHKEIELPFIYAGIENR